MKKPRRRSRINEAIKSGEIKLEVPEDNSLEKFIIDQNKALLAGYNPYTGEPVSKAYAYSVVAGTSLSMFVGIASIRPGKVNGPVKIPKYDFEKYKPKPKPTKTIKEGTVNNVPPPPPPPPPPKVFKHKGYDPQPGERTTTREEWKAQDREARIRSNLSQSSPISIPPTASVKIQSKTGYEQIQFKWSDGYYKYEGRWHTRTPGAPQDQGNTWVVERTTPGNTTGQQKTYHILTGDNQWTPRHEWQAAINARKNGTATAEQNKMLESGHWPAP